LPKISQNVSGAVQMVTRHGKIPALILRYSTEFGGIWRPLIKVIGERDPYGL